MIGVRRTADEHNLPLLELTSSDIQNRFPWLQLPVDAGAIVEAKAGYILAERALPDHAGQKKFTAGLIPARNKQARMSF